jgi:transcriptional regulator with XRE-family HTH domain
MANTFIELGNNIRKARKTLGISQEELAYRIKRDTRTVVALENGKRNPTLKTLKNICSALKISSSELLTF